MIVKCKIIQSDKNKRRIINFPRRLNKYELQQALVVINDQLGEIPSWSFVNKLPEKLPEGSKVIEMEIIIYKQKKGINTQMEEALKKASVI